MSSARVQATASNDHLIPSSNFHPFVMVYIKSWTRYQQEVEEVSPICSDGLGTGPAS